MRQGWQTLKAVWAGGGIGRILMDYAIGARVVLHGKVLDIGGRGKHSYQALLDRSATTCFHVLDIDGDETVDVIASVIDLPFLSDDHDVVLCFNVLEHVLDYRAALTEIHRVLKPGGTLYGRVPFLMPVHADPSDYWRYTAWSLESNLREAGFGAISIAADGGLFLVILNLLDPLLRRSALLRFAVAPMLLALDAIFARAVGTSVNRQRYPLGYFFVAEAASVPMNTAGTVASGEVDS